MRCKISVSCVGRYSKHSAHFLDAVHGVNIAWNQHRLVSFKMLWIGTLFGASFHGAPAVVADMCNGIAALCVVICGAERLSGRS